LRLHAYFDGEIDAVDALEIERHLQACHSCQTQLQELQQIRADLRQSLPDHRASASLRARVDRVLELEAGTAQPRRNSAPNAYGTREQWWRPRWHFWIGSLSGGGLVAAAFAAWAFLVWIPQARPLGEALVAAHVRALMSDHPVDVLSTDRHTVKPWFAGRADVSPAVADFEPQGYRLIGGRTDYLQHQRAAVLVYQHGAHTIDVFSWAVGADPLPAQMTRDGYHLACWRALDLGYCAVSDAGWEELHALQHLLQQQSAQDHP
jgi:anti-sigma factor RsiW